MGHLVVTNVINGSFACGERMGANAHTWLEERGTGRKSVRAEGDASDR